MKKLLFTLSLTLIPFYTFAYEGTISQSGSCGATDADCHYDLYEDGHLEISGTGEMRDYIQNRDATPASEAPWKGESLTSVSINGITRIGNYAFYLTSMSNIEIPNTVTQLGWGVFEATHTNNIVIPDSVTAINTYTFSHSSAENIVIEGTPKISGSAFINTKNKKIYCSSEIDCTNKGKNQGTIVPYDKQGGVYILDYGTENEKYYYSSMDMAGKTNECTKVLGECKRDVLEAKGICQGSNCDTFIQSDGQYMLKFGGKTYQDINALLKGDYDRRRIYTIEEANFVAGDKNRVSIKYR